MTLDELRAKYRTAYRIIWRERKMRLRVFAKDPVALKQKIGEMDRLEGILREMKDELKARMDNEPVQHRMLDAPRRESYG